MALLEDQWSGYFSAMPLKFVALAGAVLYYPLMLAFRWAMTAASETGSPLPAFCAFVAMGLAFSVPLIAITALIRMRDAERVTGTRSALYVIFAIPSLFSFTFSLTRFFGVYDFLGAIWISAWLAVAVLLHSRPEASPPRTRSMNIAPLRVVHGVTALILLLGFLIAHLANHSLAAWSVDLHGSVQQWLRLWYRSDWVEPVLLVLLFIMICPGIPMVLHYSRRRMDVFRVLQAATGVYISVFMCSHVFAVLNGRNQGIDTDWLFASGPETLLGSKGSQGRLIPHYFYGSLALVVHAACGIRVILLKHGSALRVGNRAFYGLVGLALVTTLVISAALMGFHIQSPR